MIEQNCRLLFSQVDFGKSKNDMTKHHWKMTTNAFEILIQMI